MISMMAMTHSLAAMRPGELNDAKHFQLFKMASGGGGGGCG